MMRRETLSRSVNDTGHCLRSPGPADRVVQSLPSSGRAQPRRDGCSIRRGHFGPRLAQKACLLRVWQPAGRYGGERNSPAIGSLLPRAAFRLPFILCLRIPDRLPLHVRGRIRTTAHERHNVIFDPVDGQGCVSWNSCLTKDDRCSLAEAETDSAT